SGAVWGSNTFMSLAPHVQADTQSLTAGTFRQYVAAPMFDRSGTGTLTLDAIDDFWSGGRVDAGVRVTTRRAVHVTDPTGTGLLTTNVALDVDPLTRGTANMSLRSTGSKTELRHAGPAVFGSGGSPTPGSVALEVQSTSKALLLSRLTTAQRDAMTPV